MRPQRVQHLDHAVVERRLEQPAVLVSLPVALDHGPQAIAGDADQRQTQLERRPDGLAQHVVVRHRQTFERQRPAK